MKSVIALLVAATLVRAESGPIELKWNELGSHIQDHDVELVLPDGAFLKGEVEAIRDEALVLNVKKTSDSKAHPKGNAVIPRASVSVLTLELSRGKWGRSVGVTLGTLTGMTLGSYVAITNTHSAAAGLSTFLSLAGAGSLTGYFVGRTADQRVTHIRVVP
jgi:hypothetical protein